MENSLSILLLILHIAALALFSKLFIFKHHKNRRLPPGPTRWPIIGNFNLIGPLPHQSFHSLSQKYGDLMQLKLGKFPVVIASSPDMAKQFLRIHDASFASRPTFAAGKFTSYSYSDTALAPYGPFWRHARKVFHNELLNEKKLESSERIRVEERQTFMSRLRDMKGKPVVVRDHILGYTISCISRTLFNKNYFSEPNSVVNLHELQEMIDEWLLLNAVFNIGDWIPWLSFVDLQGYVKRMKDLNKKFDRFNNYVIDDHLARRGGDKDFVPKDVVEVLLQLAEDPNLEVEMTRDNIKGLLQGLLIAGADPSATTVEWAIHELLKHPRIIKEAKEELDRVIGRNRWVEEKDLPQLPYINAIVMESLRLHPIGTLLIPHYAINDCNVAGYDIEKGTIVRVNVWSIGRDPKIWEKAEDFLPERFLGKEIDLRGNDFSLLTFGSGRRKCPGYRLGLKVVGTTLANLVHGFELRLVEGMRAQDVCLEEMYGLSTRPKEPISIVMEPTLPDYLYR